MVIAKCKHCNKKFQQKIFNYRYCELNDECKYAGKEAKNILIKKAIEKSRKKESLKKKSEKTFLSERLKTLTEWNNDLQKEINLIIRLIDAYHPCISSQRALGKSYDAGHFYGRQSYPELRFNLFNIYAQSVHDNQYKSGNPIGYIDGLKLTFGEQHLQMVMSLRDSNPTKITIEEIKEKIPICRSIIKWLKLQDRKFTTSERLELRQRFNNEIGIYKQTK